MINRHFDPFNMLVDEESRTLVVLNPKVMTTWMRRTYREGVHHFRQGADLSGGKWRFYPRARQFPVPGLGTMLHILRGAPDYAVFGLVRNPYRRTLSAWRDKFYDPHVTGGGDEAHYPRSMRAGELRRFRKAAARLGLEGADAGTLLPFDSFLRIIADQRDGRRNHHWDLQTLVLQTDHFEFAQTFRIEDEADAGFQTIFGRMGFTEAWVQSHARQRANASSQFATGYSESQARLMQRIFARDFIAFGYDTACPADLAR